jgi:hypothetical protein
MTVAAAQVNRRVPLIPHLSCGQQLPVTSQDDRRRGPGEQARPADTAPQLRPAAAGDQFR